MKEFKTKISGAFRDVVTRQGRIAAQRGWKRISPYSECRAEEAWYAGYDKWINNPSTLVHCTVCGRMHSDPKKCPSCGDISSQRSNMDTGDTIYMTK
jgi:rubrerythrin